MLNPSAKLSPDIFSKKISFKPLRDGFGSGIVTAGGKDKNIVLLCADLSESTRSHLFAKAHPDRFFQVGVAEQNLAAVASGLGIFGKIPFIASYATFSPGRNWEQIRTTCCYNDSNVKIMGHHAGISVGPDGATHQALEDIAITRVLPNMKVFVPCDANEAHKAVIAASQIYGPVYIRLARAGTPVMTTDKTPFQPGRGYVMFSPPKGKKSSLAIFSAGPIIYEALLAARALAKEKIFVSVINLHSVKPIDKKIIITETKKAGRALTVEEHQIAGGLGSAVAEVLSADYPAPLSMVGIKDLFGESGSPGELIKKYGLDSESIILAARRIIRRR